MGTGQRYTKTKLHKVTKLHEDKVERGHKIARRYFCTKTNLHEGTKLHEDDFAPGVNLHELHFCTRVKKMYKKTGIKK